MIKTIHRYVQLKNHRGKTVDSYDSGGIEKYMVPPVICFDDLGAEASNVSYYGNKLNVMEHIIEERYNMQKLTHFTKNLNELRILEVYGDRVKSRLYEQTNFIHIAGMDWRIRKGCNPGSLL